MKSVFEPYESFDNFIKDVESINKREAEIKKDLKNALKNNDKDAIFVKVNELNELASIRTLMIHNVKPCHPDNVIDEFKEAIIDYLEDRNEEIMSCVFVLIKCKIMND